MGNHSLINLKLLGRLCEAHKYFAKKEEYSDVVKLAQELFERGQFDSCENELSKLPSSAELLGNLVKKLKGKSICKTLKKIQEGTIENDLLTAKGLSSLLTHIIIEVEQGNSEYRVLVPIVIEKLNEVTYNTLQ